MQVPANLQSSGIIHLTWIAFSLGEKKELFGKIKTESIDIFLEFGHVAGIGVVLVLPDYYRLLEEYKPLGKALPAPYLFCANIMMMEIGVMMNEVNDDLRRNKVSNTCSRPTMKMIRIMWCCK